MSGPGRRARAKALEVAENLTCLRNRGEKMTEPCALQVNGRIWTTGPNSSWARQDNAAGDGTWQLRQSAPGGWPPLLGFSQVLPPGHVARFELY